MNDPTTAIPAPAPQLTYGPVVPCAYCHTLITENQIPVVLKGGHALHVDCYIFCLRQAPKN